MKNRIIKRIFVASLLCCTSFFFVNGAWNGLVSESGDNLTSEKWNELVNKVLPIYSSGGNVGIGTENPESENKVQIDVDASTTNRAIVVQSSDVYGEVAIENYGLGHPVFSGYRAGGTPSAPTTMPTGNTTSLLLGNGYANGQFNQVGRVSILTGDDFGDANPTSGKITFTAGAGGADVIIEDGGNVGIGIAEPSQKLDVDGIVKATGFIGDGSQLTNLPSSGGGKFVDGTDSNDAVYSGGNVGIGTNIPGEKLSVNGNVEIPNSSAYNVGGLGDTFVGGLKNTAGVLSLQSDTNRNIQLGDGDTPAALFVRNDGSIGIGTTDPSSQLHLRTSGNFPLTMEQTESGSPHNYISFRDTGGETAFLGHGDGTTDTFHIYNKGNSPIIFGTNGGEKVRVEGSGNVGIGTTTPGTNLEVAGNGYVQILNSLNSNTGKLGWENNGVSLGYLGASNQESFVALSSIGTVQFSINNTTDSAYLSGNLGIGKNATEKLDVDGTVKATAFVGDGSGLTNLPSGASALNDLSDAIRADQSIYLGLNAGNTTEDSNRGNVGIGYYTLNSNSSGYYNTGVGGGSLADNTTGAANTGIGQSALWKNIDGSSNTAVGYAALNFNESGSRNVAVGQRALQDNVSASDNTAVGIYAMENTTSGSYNVALGRSTMNAHLSGSNNVAIGSTALYANETGANNTALGHNALRNGTSGGGNVAIGYQAGLNETGSDTLYIANGSTEAKTWIYGDSSYNIGIGTITPKSKLDVSGAIKVGNDATCDADRAGAIRFDGTNFFGCDGTTWKQLDN